MEGRTAIIGSRVGGRTVAVSPYAVAQSDELIIKAQPCTRGYKVAQIAALTPCRAFRRLRKIEQINHKNEE